MHAAANERRVICYHCGRSLLVNGSARTVTCPCCYRGLELDDLLVHSGGWGGTLHTCGRIRIEPNARMITRTVRASEGIEVLGSLEARVTSGGPVTILRGGRLKGEVEATSITVEPGATLDNVRVVIRPRDAAEAAPKAGATPGR
jgi:cytoskeletal protein CcmA (bactofilin family)